jgi:hypothetical protein
MSNEKLISRLKKSNEFLAAFANQGLLDADATGILNKCIVNNTIEIDRAQQSEPKQYTEADLVAFGNALLADRSIGNYLLSEKDVTHADLENWKVNQALENDKG